MTRSGPILLACTIGWTAFPGNSTSAPVPKEGTTPFAKWSVTEDPVTNEMHDPVVVKDLVVVGTDKGALRVSDRDGRAGVDLQPRQADLPSARERRRARVLYHGERDRRRDRRRR